MPFKSKAQQGYMFAKHPKIAKKWAKETPNMKSLPQKKKNMPGMSPHMMVDCNQQKRNNKTMGMM